MDSLKDILLALSIKSMKPNGDFGLNGFNTSTQTHSNNTATTIKHQSKIWRQDIMQQFKRLQDVQSSKFMAEKLISEKYLTFSRKLIDLSGKFIKYCVFC